MFVTPQILRDVAEWLETRADVLPDRIALYGSLLMISADTPDAIADMCRRLGGEWRVSASGRGAECDTLTAEQAIAGRITAQVYAKRSAFTTSDAAALEAALAA